MAQKPLKKSTTTTEPPSGNDTEQTGAKFNVGDQVRTNDGRLATVKLVRHDSDLGPRYQIEYADQLDKAWWPEHLLSNPSDPTAGSSTDTKAPTPGNTGGMGQE